MNGSSSNCPCDGLVSPQVITNPPGRETIGYRVGDYLAFREALLRSLPGEVELANWRPGASGDLAVQMLEWWAYLADILTFYNERIANEDYLRTAMLPESVQGLIRLLGYRPRPGIGATGVLGALMNGIKPLTLPQGFQIQSKPGPGKQPQIFELEVQTQVQPPDAIAADPIPNPQLLGGQGNSVLLAGVVSSVKAGDTLLLVEKGWSGNDSNYAVLTAQSVAQEKDPRGRPNTRVVFVETPAQLESANATDYRLLKNSQTAHVWQYPSQTVIASNYVDLDSIYRGIKVGDPVLFEFGTVAPSRGIYFSPDGTNLAGGGSTVQVGVPEHTVKILIAYNSGVIAAFDDGTIYYSPDGENLAGGGSTIPVHSGPQTALAMIVYNGGVLTAFSDGTIFFSPDGTNLGGGGQSRLVYGGPNQVTTLIPFQTGVIAGFNDGNGSIFYSSDGTQLYGAGPTTELLAGSPSGGPPELMVPYGSNQIITVVPDDTVTLIWLSNGLNLSNQQVFAGPFSGVQAIVPYGSGGGVITAIYDLLAGVNTIYNSPDGQNLAQVAGNTTVVYTGPNLVLLMIAFGAGVITAFDDGTVYYSRDGKNLKGGGNTVQVYGSVPPPSALLAWNGGVITAFPAPQLQLVSVTAYSEVVWFANPDSSANPQQPPSGSPPPIAIPIPHTHITFQPSLTNLSDTPAERSITALQFSWRDVGTLIPTPATTLTTPELNLSTPLPASLLPMFNQNILLSDGDGDGVEAMATTNDPLTLALSSISDSTEVLNAPLSALFNLLPVSRGKTVANEVLGSGDATIAVGQEFVLQKSPLTYLANANSTSGFGYESTLQVWVDGVEWQEVPSFYGQAPNAQVFVTREDDQNATHVQFGDGVNGARLPSGVNNVVATYRVGSGAESPDTGSLTVILKSWPGLRSILNPVQVGGGADPDPPAQIKTYAPQSVLTFGRAISADDYEVTAAQAPGVMRARAYWSWDNTQQRMMVKVYVGDDANAVASANQALAGASDPNRPLTVILARQVPITLTLTLVVAPQRVLNDVLTAATRALVDPDNGLLGINVVQIGASLFASQVYEACMSVAGVVAVHGLAITEAVPVRSNLSFLERAQFVPRLRVIRISNSAQTASSCPDCEVRFDPGEGGYFIVSTPPDQIISPEVAASGS